MTGDKVKIGIVGIGNMGEKHVKHVIDLPNTELAAVCDRRVQRMKAPLPPTIRRKQARQLTTALAPPKIPGDERERIRGFG